MNLFPEWPPGRNPSNPYVINPYYFANRTQFSYKNSWIHYIHTGNNLCACFLGSFLTSLVLYLIFRRTPKPFQPYSRMLLLCAGVDVLYLIADFWIQGRMRIAGAYIIFSFTGPASLFPYNWQCLFMVLQAYPALLACVILPVQYAYRFYVVRYRESPSIQQTFVYFSLAVLAISVTSLCVIPIFSTLGGKDAGHDYADVWFEEREVPVLIIGSMTYWLTIFACFYTLIILLLAYGLCFWFARRTLTLLTTNEHYLSEKTRSLQRQFSRTLFMQSITPGFTSLLPLCITITSLILHIDTGYVGEYAILSLTWCPVVNSLSTLLLIHPYRRFCLQLFGLRPKRVHNSSVAHQQQVGDLSFVQGTG